MSDEPEPKPILCDRCRLEVAGKGVILHICIFAKYHPPKIDRCEHHVLCPNCGQRLVRDITNFVKHP